MVSTFQMVDTFSIHMSSNKTGLTGRLLMIAINTWMTGIRALMKIIKRLMNFMRALRIRLRPHRFFVKTGKAAASVTSNGKDGFVICNLRLDNNTRLSPD
jgi:hypothetical protein